MIVWIDLKKLRDIGPTYGLNYVSEMLKAGKLAEQEGRVYIELSEYLRVKKEFNAPNPIPLATSRCC